ncbi:MAG: Rieske 2Fe-2S domain-containing protein [Dermatophilaceae bacterium]
MNDKGTASGTGQASGTDVVHGTGSGTQVALPDLFPNPGLPPHVHRAADDSPKAAKRAERQVAALFTLSILGTIGFIVAYFGIDKTKGVFIPFVGLTNLLNVMLGVTMAVGLLGIGFGAIHWAKTIMPDEEVVEERHEIRSADADREAAVAVLAAGGEAAQIGRRPLIKWSLAGALGLFALPMTVQLVGSLGDPTKALTQLKETLWDIPPGGKPIRLVRDPEGHAIKASDVVIGSVFHVMPETLDKTSKHVLEDKAKAAVLLMRLDQGAFADTDSGRKAKSWGYQGIVAYSKICTHVGCPVGLYEQQTHHLLCPCHQSTFDVTRDCEVIFGPAKRPLPQLKITVDDAGYLVATQGFAEPVGPSYWERLK